METRNTGATKALAYIRVSTEIQVVDGASLDAQTSLLETEAMRRGWSVEIVADCGLSGKNLQRPGLQEALRRLDAGEADALLAVRLDRISRSVADFAGLLARANKRGWRLIVVNPSLDSGDAAGKFTAHVLAAAAEYERDLIGIRTKEGMAQRRAEGVHVGRPHVLPQAVVARIVADRAGGTTIRAIAKHLTDEGVSTARGGTVWSPSSVQGVLSSTRVSRAEQTAGA